MTEEQVFLAALDLPDATARAAYLDETCGENAEFRRQIEALLAAHFRSGSFLDVPAAEQVKAGSREETTVTISGAAVSAEKDHEDESDDLPFLTPSTRPESLGRLGHYEVLQVLGKGGFGIVFRAFDEVLQRVVAVKVMAPQMATLSPARKRFLREARSSAAVRHENVVQVYEVGEQPLPYLVMEFIPGETLQQKLDRQGPLDVPEVLRIGRQVAEGLAAAHACDLIHRDVKPGNILLEGGAHKAKITDFGLARAADDASISQSGIIAGTPMFMAPEQALGHHIDQRADLFSLGSVLYQMVSGRPPFRAPSALAVLKRVAEEPPRPIPEIIPETPDWLCGIIAKLHAKNPADRFQSAREVADLLADCEAKLKAKQEVGNVLPAAVKPAGRKWVAAAAVLLLPVIALAVTEIAGITHLFQRQQPTPGPERTPPIQVAKLDTPPLAVAPFDAAKAKEHQEAWAKHLGVDVETTNSIGMKMRLIPPGQFLMGSPDDEAGRDAHEGPQHEVVLTKPIRMGVHDVTVGQFKAFVKAMGYQTKAERDGGAWRPFPDGFWKQDPQVNWENPGFEQTDDHPVVCVSWFDAKAFCDWLSHREGKKYTLPTEAQWEYACRAGSNTKFSFGDDDQELGQHGWYKANSNGKPNPVGQRKPNSWGLNDVESNVAQWTADWFTADFYQKSPKEDPIGPAVGTVGTRVLRGGNWWDGPNPCRAAFRGGTGFWDPWKSSINIGFRVVQVGDLKAKSPPLLAADAIRQGRYRAPDLSHAKPIYEDRFQDPKSGWAIGKGDYYEVGYKDDRYFMAVMARHIRAQHCSARPAGNFACEVVGRIDGISNASWCFDIQNQQRKCSLFIRVNGKQEVEIETHDHQTQEVIPLRSIQHPVIKPGKEFNTLLVIGRGQAFEIYANGVLICPLVSTDFITMPATCGLVVFAESLDCRAEFERVTIWNADSLPTLRRIPMDVAPPLAK